MKTYVPFTQRLLAAALALTTAVACNPELEDAVDVGQAEQALTVGQFTSSYALAWGGACTYMANNGIVGYAPTTSGVKYPLFIFQVGTAASYNSSAVLAMLSEAASKGLVAVSAQYDNGLLGGCADIRLRSQCIYDPTDANSLVSKMCARADVDCNLGILVAGHSQGSTLANYAKNWNNKVRAVYGLGVNSDIGSSYGSGDQPGASNPNGTADDKCLLDSSTAVATNRVRFINGINDFCAVGATCTTGYGAQGELQRISGTTCANGATSCLNSDGSGWTTIANASVQDGDADHSYFVVGTTFTLDSGFAAPATNDWSWGTNVSWLMGFTGTTNGVPVRINAGSTTATNGAFSKDDGFSGTSSVYSHSNTINVTGVANAAPAHVYQTYRYASGAGGKVSYTIPGLAPSTSYTVRLHFAENYYWFAGGRKFHVNIQSVRKETDLDVFAQAGAQNKALVKDYTITSDSTGKILVEVLVGSAGEAIISGIEVL